MTDCNASPSARRRHVRGLVLAAAKARAEQALTLESSETTLFAPYSPSPISVITAVWNYLASKQVEIQPDDLVIDLGCGDGRWLIAAVQRHNCSALGIEVDSALVNKAQQNVECHALEQKIRVVQGDIMQADISQGRLVIVYAFAESLHGIRKFLETQLSSRASVLSIGFRVPEWRATWSDRVDGLRWYFYNIQDCILADH